jgi:Leucine-rich repeat (LRR) protein
MRFSCPARRTLLILSIVCPALIACKGYEVTVNERTVYSPAPLFTHFKVADQNLQRCLDQTIKDAAITAAGQLDRLNCSHAGIQSLEGLDQFSAIKHLNLADNLITEAAVLAQLSKLRQVVLRNNKLTHLPEALTWIAVDAIDVSGNPALACADLLQLAANPQLDIILPEHCAAP